MNGVVGIPQPDMSLGPRLCFVGPMVGVNEGWVVTQGEILADLFAREGYEVRMTSTKARRLPRLVDTVRSMASWRDDVDVFVVMVFSGPGFVMADASTWLARRFGKPVVLVLRGGNLPAFTQQHDRWVRRVLNRADAIVAPSGYLRELCETIGVDVGVIPNVLDLDEYPYRERTAASPRLLWMRTFHPIYDPRVAIDVLERVKAIHPDATLTMAGQDKGLFEDVRGYVRSRGLEDSVRFPGFLSKESKDREFAAHDVYLHTNLVDNMPVSVVESAAYGVPVVATRVGGIPHLLDDGETGLLVPPGDADEMAAAVLRLLSEPDLVGRLSRGARRMAEASAWRSVKEEWERVFEQVSPSSEIGVVR